MALGAGASSAKGLAPSIVGGGPASPGEYPAQGLLSIAPSGSCGGTLVGSRWFLTAAHCAADDFGIPLPPSSFQVRFGHVDRTQMTDVYGVTAVAVNASFNPETFQNDVAMLKLDRPAPYPFMRVIGTDETSKWTPGTPARIIGWGHTGGGSSSNVLLEANVPIVSDTTCFSQYEFHVPQVDPSKMVCAGDGVHDTCQGDSGGPLLVPDGAAFVLAGITSWGEGCADPDFSGVYTRLGAPTLNAWVMARFPRASFSVTSGTVHSGQSATFASTSFHPEGASGFTTFQWDFTGDGSFDDAGGSSVSRTFPSGGTFSVGLEASTPGGDHAVARQLVTVNGTPSAAARGSATAYQVREGATVRLSGSGIDPEGQPLTFTWDLDRDGSLETSGRDVTFSAARIDGPATRAVTIQACDTLGGCSRATGSVRVTNVAPRPRAGPDRRTRVGRRVCFRGRASDAGRDRLRVTWRFGNGRTARGLRACTRYRRPGRFTARMTVRDDDGAAAADRLRVRVLRRPR
jgi:Trypsin/PKD domain